jgi:hypothetical protein
MSVRIRTTHPEDVEYVAKNMREHDKIEVWLSHKHTPLEALQHSVKSRRCWTVLHEGVPFCIFGVADACLITGKGSPWLLATDEMTKHKRDLLIRSRAFTDVMKQEFKVLENYVWDGNKQSKRWLKWLGYEFVEKVALGHRRATFWRFRMENDV